MERRDTVAALQSLLNRKPVPPGERCDFCSVPVGDEHSHFVEVKARRILCSCRPCYIVMEPQGAALGRYKPIPSRYVEIASFSVDDATWEGLQIPIGLAFFFFNSLEGKMGAFYPGPAGATESLLPLETWDAIASQQPLFATLEPDTEAILVHRTKSAQRWFIVPVDAAYELVGLMRSSWHGFDGGPEAWGRIETFFTKIGERSRGRVTARMS